MAMQQDANDGGTAAQLRKLTMKSAGVVFSLVVLVIAVLSGIYSLANAHDAFAASAQEIDELPEGFGGHHRADQG